MQVHPNFSAIFTSNPEEYAGVHKTQDALLDRMITIKVGHHDPETETAITAAKSGLPMEAAARIAEIVSQFRNLGVNNHRPTIRACIMIARIVALRGANVERGDPVFRETCRDVLCTDTVKITRDGEAFEIDRLEEIINQVCPSRSRSTSASGAALVSVN
jgi:gas vesicle protein GvpN